MRCAPLILPAALVLGACASAPAGPDVSTGMTTVTVTATYRERILLPPGHVLTVRIEDVSLADAPATVLAESVEPLDGRAPPYAVTLGLPTAQIDPRHAYAARAEIRDPAGRLAFVTDTRHAVLTQGAPPSADIVLKAAR